MKTFHFYILIGLLLLSCTKDVQLDLPTEDQRLVIEGYVELNKFPIVYLTKTKKYTDKINKENITEYIASVAKVTVSNGIESEVLTLKLNQEIFPYYYFECTSIKGEIGKEYTITVELNGEKFTSTTKLVEPVEISSYNFVALENNADRNFIDLTFLDPVEDANFYRVYIQRIGKDKVFTPCYLSTFNDLGFNGKEFSYQVIRNYSSSFQSDDERYFLKGDSVLIKFCTTDKVAFQYWKSLEGLIAVSANPFGLSSNAPLSSFNGDALGVWCGLSSKYYKIKIQ